MKTPIIVAFFAATLLTSGCFVYERRSPQRVVVHETVPARETVITTLPTGYRSRVYSGTTYYYSGNTYYRVRPAGGYVITPRPW